MFQRQLIILQQPRAHRVKDALGQIRLVIYHQAKRLIAHQLDHIFQHPAGAHQHQLHAIGQIGLDVAQKVAAEILGIRPGKGLKAGLIMDAGALVDGARFLLLVVHPKAEV